MLATATPPELLTSHSFYGSVESELEDVEKVPAFALPPKTVRPVRRSLQIIRDISRRQVLSHLPIRRSLSQKRKLKHVCFRDDNLTECHEIERVSDELKPDLWYNSNELAIAFSEEMRSNLQLLILHGPSFPLENVNLTWRGIEEHVPTPDSDAGYNGHTRRMERIRAHTERVLAAARVQGEGHEHGIATRSEWLSAADRQVAIERAQKDEIDAAHEHGLLQPHGPTGPSHGLTDLEREHDHKGMIMSLVRWFCY